MNKAAIIEVLRDISVLLELKGDNPFKIRAYSAGVRALEAMEEELEQVISENRLGSVKGIGSALESKIRTLYETGELEYYTQLQHSVEPGLIEMLEIPGLGGKKIAKLHKVLGVDSINSLQALCENGKVADLKGFGPKTEEKILKGIRNRAAYATRHLWWTARAVAEPILESLRALPPVEQAEVAGSLRRLKETVGDLDFIVASTEATSVMGWFVGQAEVREVTAQGRTKSSVRFHSGLQADIRVVPREQFACALHHFTGSKEHNVLMRQRALRRGYRLSEWGLSRKEGYGKNDRTFSIRSEKELFEFLGLSEIPPEWREGGKELEWAEAREMPEMVSGSQIQGVFHNHTTASDGRNSLEEMALAAEARNWSYLGLADHSKASFQANGLNDARIFEQISQIRAFNRSGQSKVHLFSGVECDILSDGSLDLEADTLKALDYTVVSVHSHFTQSEEAMTARVIRAIEHPASTMLGHPTGRLLLKREPYRINLQKVIDAAIANRVIIEINANPRRLDMDWRLWQTAAEKGLMCAINPDAHTTEGLDYYQAGLNVARKGRIPVEQILNCRDRMGVSRWFNERK